MWGLITLGAGIVMLLVAATLPLIPITAHALVFTQDSDAFDAAAPPFMIGAVIFGVMGIAAIVVGAVMTARSGKTRRNPTTA